MQRYLLNVSYIGSAFRGVVRIEPYYVFGDAKTVQGCLERAITSVVKKKCDVSCSSRTDAGVHGLSTYFQMDYEHDDIPIDVHEIHCGLNDKLWSAHCPIRINGVQLVDKNLFVAHRNVFSRSYLYRFAVQNSAQAIDKDSRLSSNQVTIPIEEVDRCYFIRWKHFDIDRFKKAAELLSGKHDFRTFMERSRNPSTKGPNYPHRSMLSVRVEAGRPALSSYNLAMCEKNFTFFELHLTARSFVFRQIRRIVGALCSVATQRISEQDFYEMLTIPSHTIWENMEKEKLVSVAPACGLHLHSIIYKSAEEWDATSILENARGVNLKPFFSDRKYKINKLLKI